MVLVITGQYFLNLPYLNSFFLLSVETDSSRAPTGGGTAPGVPLCPPTVLGDERDG